MGAKHAVREQWIGGKKMILVLDDDVMTFECFGESPTESSQKNCSATQSRGFCKSLR